MADQAVHRYDGIAQLFHWLIAILIFVVFGLGWYMTDLDLADPGTFQIYQIHKGIGVLIFGLAVLRLVWRWTHPAPPLPAGMKDWERFAARGAHILLYGLILLQPLVGFLQSNAANFPVVLFGVYELPALIGQNKALGDALVDVHHFAANVMAALVLVHMAAALRHHVIIKDDVLRQMLPGAAVGAAVVILAFGLMTPFFWSPDMATKPDAAIVASKAAEEVGGETSRPESPIAADSTPAPVSTIEQEATGGGGDGLWVVEDESALRFIAKQQGSDVEGWFQSFDAEIRFDPNDLSNSRLSVDIDATSITTGHTDRDKMLNSPSFFDTAQWPKASFQSASIVAKDDGFFGALGELTIRDVTKEVTLPFTVEIKSDPDNPAVELAHAQGELPIERLDYGIGQGDWASTVTVAGEVVIIIDIRATRTKVTE